jgi:hypothetical protein
MSAAPRWRASPTSTAASEASVVGLAPRAGILADAGPAGRAARTAPRSNWKAHEPDDDERTGEDPPFSAFEWQIAWRYLRARRKEGGISVIAGYALVGVMLGWRR